MNNNKRNRGSIFSVTLFLIFLLILAIIAYAIFRSGNGVQYQQGQQSVSNSTSSVGTSAANVADASSSPVSLISISPATTTVDSTITLNGAGFSIGPGSPGVPQVQNQSQTGNGWINQDHVIVWLTRQNAPQSILAGIGSYGILPTSSNATSSASSTSVAVNNNAANNSANPSTQSAVLWEGSPGSDSDTAITTSIPRFICTMPNTQAGGGTVSLANCPTIFAVTPGTYTLTVAIPYLNIVSNPLTLTITATALSSETYTNTQYGYTLTYPDDLTFKENTDYPPTPGVDITSTVFTLPKTYYPDSTIGQASVDIAVTGNGNDNSYGTAGNCSEWPDGQETFSVQSTITAGPTTFDIRQDTSVGASNLYSTTEYSTEQGGQCYRISLYSHVQNPDLYTDDAVQIAHYAAANGAAEQMLVSVLAEIAEGFNFTKK